VFRRLPVALPIACAVLTALATSAQAVAARQAAPTPSYHVALKATLHVGVPADAVKNGWCCDAGLVDPVTHAFYLANTADKAMTPVGHFLVVTNSAEKHPFISLIDLRTNRVVSRYTFATATATGGLGGVEWWRGHLYVSVSATRQSPAGGEVDELGISGGRTFVPVQKFTFASCGAAGLSVYQERPGRGRLR
jgi:hypothetical protein